MKKYFIVSIVVLALSAAMISGCGQGGGDSAPTTTATVTTTSTSHTTSTSNTTTTTHPTTTTTTTSTTTTTLKTSAPSIKGPGDLANTSIEANSIIVTIEAGASGADAIYYTTNESTPTTGSILYSGPFVLEKSKTIKAIAVKAGRANSNISSSWFDLYWWQALGSGMDNRVNALAFDNSGKLYAGGQFSHAGGVPADNIAVWNGSSWSQLGNGIYGSINALKINAAGDVYLGGNVLWEISIPYDYHNMLTKWDTSLATYEILSELAGGDVWALEFLGTDLYVGGQFKQAGNMPGTYCIAKWKPGSSTWESLGGDGLNGTVYSFSLLGSELYVGGNFTKTSDEVVTLRKLAKYFEGDWTEIGNGGVSDPYMINHVNAFSSNDVLVGGDFLDAGGVSAVGLMRWNDSSWSLVGGNNHFGYTVSSVIWRNYLCVGGWYPAFGNANLARYDGVNWSKFGNMGLNSVVSALVIGPDGNLYAGGYFTKAGSVEAADYIAMWGKKL